MRVGIIGARLWVSSICLVGLGCGGDAAPEASGATPTASSSATGSSNTATPSAAAPAAGGAPTTLAPGAAATSAEGVPLVTTGTVTLDCARDTAPAYVAEAPRCEGSGGDARAMRDRLREIERAPEVEPPAVASLLEGCAASRASVARSLLRGGNANLRGRSYPLAARWFQAALEADPSSLDARLGLAQARAENGEAEPALCQLAVIRGAGEAGLRPLDRALRDRHFADLRQDLRFWAVVPAPAPIAVTSIEGVDEEIPEGDGLAFDFSSELEDGDGLWSRVPLAIDQFNDIGRAIRELRGNSFSNYAVARPERFTAAWLPNVERIGLGMIAHPVVWKPTPDSEYFAVPLFGTFDGADQVVLIIAEKSGSGIRVLYLLTDTGCAEPPVLLASRDHRVLGWSSSCAQGDDPTTLRRCVLYATDEGVKQRCGTGGPAAAPAEATATEPTESE